MVSIEVGTHLWVDTTGSLTLLADVQVVAVHAIHVGRWSTQIGQITLEVVHLHDLLHLVDDALFRAA